MIEITIMTVLLMCLIFGGILFLIGIALGDFKGFVLALIGFTFVFLFIFGVNSPLNPEAKYSDDFFVYENVPQFATPTKECYYNGFTIERKELLVKCFGDRKDCLVEKLDLKNGLVYCKGKIIDISD
jgi:hypothetical protein